LSCAALALSGCGAPEEHPKSTPVTLPEPVPTVDTDPPSTTDTTPTAVVLPAIFTIVLENHDYAEVVDSPDAPYLNSLIADYGLATDYRETGKPSLPNYLSMISGDTQGATVDSVPTKAPLFPVKADNLGTQMQGAGIPWRSYQESMETPCKLINDGNYVPRHDPFLYFDDVQNGPDDLCANTNVDYTEFADDLAAGSYTYMWITPNLLDDGHNPHTEPVVGLQQSDAWCAVEIPKILASDAWKAGGVLFVTWDEADGRNGDDPTLIPMIVVSNRVAAGTLVDLPLTHFSYLATVEDLLGLPRLPTVATTQGLESFFQPE
jgi:hypothetical protein